MGGGSWAPVILAHYSQASRLDPSLRLTPFLQQHFDVSTRRALARQLAHKSVQTGITQTALRVAPRLVRQCSSCGRRFTSLRREAPVKCERCVAPTGP